MQKIGTTIGQLQSALAILGGLVTAVTVSKTTGVPVTTETRLDSLTAAMTELAGHVETLVRDEPADDARVAQLEGKVDQLEGKLELVTEALQDAEKAISVLAEAMQSRPTSAAKPAPAKKKASARKTA